MRARAALATLVALTAAVSSAPASAAAPRASGKALALRVVVGGDEKKAGEVVAPPAASLALPALSYGDGVVETGAAWMRARATSEERARAVSAATVRTISLFGGEITVGAASTKAAARASGQGADGTLARSWLADVTILGETVRPGVNVRVPLADWGYAVLLEQAVVPVSGRRHGRRTSVTGLHVQLTADHGGLPAGSEVVVAYAEAAASVPRPAPQPTTPAPPESSSPSSGPSPSRPPREPAPQPPGARPAPPPVVRHPPPALRPRLAADGYVFPVFGPSSFSDDFGAPRAVTGWHHGNDVFAPLGAPVLAVADGSLFLVGWNDVGGNRLWLRDTRGNEFYYAHLSAFSPLAFNGSEVRAGDVLGFVGATGDAVGTPPHLHFEVHPSALLGLGYDGVVDPYEYLLAWQRLVDANLDWGEIGVGEAPAPGVVLLQAEDISTTSGLDPEALARTLELPALLGEAAAG